MPSINPLRHWLSRVVPRCGRSLKPFFPSTLSSREDLICFWSWLVSWSKWSKMFSGVRIYGRRKMLDPPPPPHPPFTARTCFWPFSASDVCGYTQRSQDIDWIFFFFGAWIKGLCVCWVGWGRRKWKVNTCSLRKSSGLSTGVHGVAMRASWNVLVSFVVVATWFSFRCLFRGEGGGVDPLSYWLTYVLVILYENCIPFHNHSSCAFHQPHLQAISLSLSISSPPPLPLCLSVSVSVSLCFSLSLSLSVCLSLPPSLSACLPQFLQLTLWGKIKNGLE